MNPLLPDLLSLAPASTPPGAALPPLPAGGETIGLDFAGLLDAALPAPSTQSPSGPAAPLPVTAPVPGDPPLPQEPATGIAPLAGLAQPVPTGRSLPLPGTSLPVVVVPERALAAAPLAPVPSESAPGAEAAPMAPVAGDMAEPERPAVVADAPALPELPAPSADAQPRPARAAGPPAAVRSKPEDARPGLAPIAAVPPLPEALPAEGAAATAPLPQAASATPERLPVAVRRDLLLRREAASLAALPEASGAETSALGSARAIPVPVPGAPPLDAADGEETDLAASLEAVALPPVPSAPAPSAVALPVPASAPPPPLATLPVAARAAQRNAAPIAAAAMPRATSASPGATLVPPLPDTPSTPVPASAAPSASSPTAPLPAAPAVAATAFAGAGGEAPPVTDPALPAAPAPAGPASPPAPRAPAAPQPTHVIAPDPAVFASLAEVLGPASPDLAPADPAGPETVAGGAASATSATASPAPAPAPTALAAAAGPAQPAHAPEPRAAAPGPHQQSTIDQVGDLREALRSARPAMTLNHAEFGAVSLRLEAGGSEGWRAVLASRDPGFVPAIQAALDARAVQAAAASSDSAQNGGNFLGHSGTGEHRSGSSPSGGQGASQPYLGQSGGRDGEAAPDHRRPSTAAALAARAEAEDGGPGSAAPHAGGLFA
ncbi:hypothetical protein ACLBKU_04285 [Erythrobacter sp. NE805]|uniref:hypothetical protein n=1 Tax=Erythrobacter sp. NE805 TaxID=3389875 RepID=UPI00396B4352